MGHFSWKEGRKEERKQGTAKNKCMKYKRAAAKTNKHKFKVAVRSNTDRFTHKQKKMGTKHHHALPCMASNFRVKKRRDRGPESNGGHS